MNIKINPQEIPEIVAILKELTSQPMIIADEEPDEEKIVQDTVTADEYLENFIKKRLEEAQLDPSDGIIADIYPLVKKEFDELVNILRLKYTNMADYKAMQYATAARKANQYIAILTNTNENNEYLNDFVKALEAACLNIPDAQKELMFEGLTETCKKDPIVFLGLSYSANSVKAAEKEADNLPRESNEYDDIFRLFYRYIETVSAEWGGEDMTAIDWDSPYVIREIDNYKASVNSSYSISIDASDKNRILLSIERLNKQSGYYSNMHVTKELFCARFQFVDNKLAKVYITDPISDWVIYNSELAALVVKLDTAITEFKPEVIIREVNDYNVHL